ncbi:MAG: hypothetical protein PHU80_06120 [Kiritimatiellae bacterium]|nr:hypothetical protein [Kiritimatiellia bacterium]
MDFADIEGVEEQEALEHNPGCITGFARALFAMLAVVAVAFALLPVAMSSDPGRRLILGRVNAAIAPAKVSAGGWSLGWFTKASVSEPFYENPAQGVVFRGDEVRFDRGLLRLLPVGKLDLGTVTLVKPDIAVSLVPQPVPEVTEPGIKPKKKGFFFLPVVDAGLGLAFEDGRLEVRGQDGEALVASRVNGLARMESYRKPADVDFSMAVGGGTVTLQGRLQSIRDFIKERDDQAQSEKISLKLVNVDVTALRPLMLYATGKEWLGGGTADGVVTVEQSGKGRFAAECGMLVNGFCLEDGDRARSPAGDLALMADLWFGAEGIEIRKFDFSSPWLRAEAQGKLYGWKDGGVMTGKLNAKATARMPVIARDFASVLGLSPSFTIEKGDLNAVFSVEGGADALLLDAKAETSGLLMKSGGETLTLKPEPSLLFKARFPYGEWPDVETFHFKAPFADVYGKGRFDSAVVKGRLDLTRFARDFKKILKYCPPMVGSAYVDVATSSGAGMLKLTSFVKLSDLAVETRPGQMVVLPQGTVKFVGSVPVQGGKPDREINNVDFSAVLDDGSIEGGWQRLALSEDGSGTVLRGLSVKSSLEIASAGRLLGGVLPAAAQRRLRAWQGRVLANVTAEMAGGVLKALVNAGGVDLRHTAESGVWRIPDVRLEGAVSREGPKEEVRLAAAVAGGVAFERDGQVIFAEPAGKGDVDLRVLAGGDALMVPSLSLKTGLLEMNAQAEVKELSGRCLLKAKGRAALDFAELAGLLDVEMLEAFEITGRKAREFSFAAPLAGGLATVMSEGEFSGASCIESLKGMGMTAGPADISVRLSQGVLKMAYEPVLNSGRLRLVPEIQVGTRGITVSCPPKTRLLENVAITQEMVDTLLARINPLFQGSVVKNGKVTVDLKSFDYAPAAVPEKQVASEMDILFSGLSMDMGPALREILTMIRVKERRYEVDRLPVHLVIKDGRVNMAPVRIVVDRQPIICSGWVAFDGTIKYLIEVPVTERLAGRAAGKVLGNMVIKIPVAGTVDEPRLDTSALKNAMADMFKSVVNEQTVEKVGDFLEKLQRELRK